jgi:hypothetical protein
MSRGNLFPKDTMDCKKIEVEGIAEGYFLGTLSEATRDAFEDHFFKCDNCSGLLEGFEIVRQHGIVARPHWDPNKSRGSQRWWIWVPVPLTAILALVSFIVLRPNRAPVDVPVGTPLPATATKNPPVHNEQLGQLAINSRDYTGIVIPTTKTPTKENKSLALNSGMGAAPSVSPSTPAATVVPNDLQATVQPAPQELIRSTPDPQPLGRQIPPSAVSDEAAEELFRIAMVEPPPFAFPLQSRYGTKARPEDSLSRTEREPSNHPSEARDVPLANRQNFQSGMIAYAERRYKDAAIYLENAANAEPSAPDARFYLAICELMLGKPDRATDSLKKVLSLGGSPYQEAAHFYLAKSRLQVSDYSGARAELETTIAIQGKFRTQATVLLERLDKVHP